MKYKDQVVPSPLDDEHFLIIRRAVSNAINEIYKFIVSEKSGTRNILVVAPDEHDNLGPFQLTQNAEHDFRIHTLQLDPTIPATYHADITKTNLFIPENLYDLVICTEVVEHCSNPFKAVNEIQRLLKVGGVALFTSPFDFRIHGPRPDNWRISEDGWQALLESWEIVSITSENNSSRPLMPIHYTVIAKK
jgi:SAM-dependent methyltransferase